MRITKSLLVLLLVLVLACAAFGQATQIRSVTSLPLSCNPGTNNTPADMVALVSGTSSALYWCSSANVWTLLGSVGQFQITTLTLPQASIGVSYSATIQTANGVGTVTCAFTSGADDQVPGIVINPDCTITGTPTSPGARTFQITATDSSSPNPRTAAIRYTIAIVCSSLQLVSAVNLPPADQSFAWSYQYITLGGITPLTFTGSGFPTGVTVNSSTGLASGTPSVKGTFTPSVTVTDSCPAPASVSQSFNLIVNGTLAVTTNTFPNGTVGTAFSGQLANAGGTAGFTWTVNALPAGLSLNGATGAVTGTPTTPGTTNSTFTVTDSLSATAASPVFPIVIGCRALILQTTSIPSGTQNIAYQFGITATGGSGSLSYTATGLPTGLTINSSTGVISGTPTVSGDFSTVNITVTDSCPTTAQTQTATYDLVIAAQAGALTITNGTLPQAIEGVPYGPIPMNATGGTPPYTWTLFAGSFPTGISMTSGVISGTPTATGTSTPDIKVTDNVAANTHLALPITVVCSTLSVTTTGLPPGTQTTAYSSGLASTGGTGTVTWGATGLPTGLTINSSTGVISGTPSVNGTFSVIATATDSCSPTPQAVPKTFSLQINSASLAISTQSLPSGVVQQAYSATLSGVGGTLPYTWSITSGSLPTGLSLTGATGVISGTPTTAQITSVTIQLADSAAHVLPATFSIAINTVTGADNTYCSPSGTWLGPATDGPANLPTTCYYTALNSTPSPGTVHSAVPASSLATAYASAVCGDTIVLTAGTIGTGPFTLTGKHCDTLHYITIESSGVSNIAFPAEGTRATPCIAGVASLLNRQPYPCATPTVLTARLVAPASSNAVILDGADTIRFIGIEFTRITTVHTNISQIINMGSTTASQTHHIIFDRVWIHGVNADGTFPQSSATDTSTTRGIFLGQSNHVAVIDSYISDFYDNGATATNGNTDAQCMAGGFGGRANTGWGVYKFVNNHCEGASEGILLGGSGGPPLTPSGCTFGTNCNVDVPLSIEVRRNYFFASKAWNGNTTTINAVGYPNRKNGIEFKTGASILLEANIFENCWYSSQPYCYAFDFAPKNQSNLPNTPVVGTCPSCLVQDFVARYNYSYNYPGHQVALYSSMDIGCSNCTTLARRGSIHDNLVGDSLNKGSLTLGGFGCMEFLASAGPITNISARHNTCVSSPNILMVFGATAIGQLDQITFQDNLMAEGGFGVQASSNAGSGCDGGGTGHPNYDSSNNFLGILNACVNGTSNTWTADHNGIWGSSSIVNWPSGNTLVANISAVGFTSVPANNTSGFPDSGFNPSTFKLLNASAFHNAGSDGKDLGVDILTLQTKIAGVRQ